MRLKFKFKLIDEKDLLTRLLNETLIYSLQKSLDSFQKVNITNERAHAKNVVAYWCTNRDSFEKSFDNLSKPRIP